MNSSATNPEGWAVWYARRVVLVIGLTLAVGCGQNATTKQDEKPRQTAEQLRGRLDAAEALTVLGDRVEAFKEVAEDAADAGEAEIARMALEKITIQGTKEQVAEACALKLARRGDTKAAKDIAELITTPGTKEKVLEQIAKRSQ
jgi:hypothetical protein